MRRFAEIPLARLTIYIPSESFSLPTLSVNVGSHSSRLLFFSDLT